LDDTEFLRRMEDKIRRLTGREVVLRLDETESDQMSIDLNGPGPVITLGSYAVRYSGFARMALEYAVASIREGREISQLEFHMLLSRN
jgi:hypothetical protein